MKKYVFVLGAGFSADVAGYPTLAGLSKAVSRSLRIDYRKRWTIGAEMKFPPSIYNNIERLMSYLIQDHPWKNEIESHIFKSIYATVIDILNKQFDNLESQNAGFLAANEDAKALIKIWHEQKATIASFNYDTLIEQLVLNMRGKYFPQDIPVANLYQIPISHIASRSGAVTHPGHSDTLKLLKLHGSANWFYSASGHIGDQIYYCPPNVTEEDQEMVKKNKRGLRPFLIPPLLDKTNFYFNHAVQVQWRMFRDALLEAEYLCFIGYSFPPSDTTIVTLFEEIAMARQMHRKRKIKGIALVKEKSESNYKAIRERYLSIFGSKFKVENVQGKSVLRAVEWLSQ